MAGFQSKVFKLLIALTLAFGTLTGQKANDTVEITSNPKDLGDRTLNARVVELVQQNEFLKARPFLLEMKERLAEDAPDDDSTLEPVSFFLASSYLQEFQETDNKQALRTAIELFQEYVAKFPTGPRRTIALLNLGDAYSDLEEYEKAIQVYADIYESPRTSGAVRSDIRRVIAKTYLKTDAPDEGMPYFIEAYERAILNEEARAEASTWLLQAYLAKGEIDKIRPYFKHLTGRKAALFNPKFNVSLIKAGDDLFKSGNYDFAILFYEIVKKKEDIVEFYEDAVQKLRQALSYKKEGTEDAITLEQRLREAEANLKAVKGIRDYDADVRWRSARVLLESERTWEALWSFYNLMLDYPGHEQAEEFLFLAFSQARRVKDPHMVIQLAKDYLAQENYDKYRGQITLDLATYYQEQGSPDKFYDLATEYLASENKEDKVASQLANLLAIHLMERKRYSKLFNLMDRYQRTAEEKGSTRESSQYWRALALVITGDYKEGLESLNAFVEEYGTNSIFSEDAYYRRAICLYGIERVDKAYEEFTDFVKTFPQSSRRGEAELYLGDIMREQDQLDRAVSHYKLVEDFTDRMTFITKAVFAISEVLERQGKDDEAAQVILTYVEDYGESAELSEAYLKLGNFAERKGRPADRFRYNILGLEATANDPNRYAADQILNEYVEDYPKTVKHYESAIELIDSMLADSDYRDRMLNDRAAQFQFFQSEEGQKVDPKFAEKIMRDREFRKDLLDSPETILRNLRAEYSEKLERLEPYKPDLVFSRLLSKASGSKTVLELRLAMAREKLTGSKALSQFTDQQIRQASPAVMLWHAKNLRQMNPAKASALLEFSLEKHPYAPNPYETMLTKAKIAKDKAMNAPTQDNLEAALAEYEQIIERFGRRAEDGVPFLAKGEILVQLGRKEAALDVLSNILRNPEWRGRPHAKAHLQLGLAYYNSGDYAKAHGFFERLMLGFSGFADEVALAYYWDLKTLESMNEDESVDQLLTEIRNRSDLKETKGYRLIEENYAL